MVTWSLLVLGCHLLEYIIASHVLASSTGAGSAASAAEALKELKYADITNGVNFIPVAIKTSGIWGRQAIDLIKNICQHILEVTDEPRSTAFLRQRIIPRDNAESFLRYGYVPGHTRTYGQFVTGH